MRGSANPSTPIIKINTALRKPEDFVESMRLGVRVDECLRLSPSRQRHNPHEVRCASCGFFLRFLLDFIWFFFVFSRILRVCWNCIAWRTWRKKSRKLGRRASIGAGVKLDRDHEPRTKNKMVRESGVRIIAMVGLFGLVLTRVY